MKTGFLSAIATAMAVTASIALFPSASLSDTPADPASTTAKAQQKWPGVVVSLSASATISAEGLEPGGEIWGEWYSLPSG